MTWDSADTAVRSAYRKVSRKVHPDHGGKTEDQQKLNDAYSQWENATKEASRNTPNPKTKFWALGREQRQKIEKPLSQTRWVYPKRERIQ